MCEVGTETSPRPASRCDAGRCCQITAGHDREAELKGEERMRSGTAGRGSVLEGPAWLGFTANVQMFGEEGRCPRGWAGRAAL